MTIVIEFKIAQKFDDIEKRAEYLLKQIEEKYYYMELRSEWYKNIIRYGISFCEKVGSYTRTRYETIDYEYSKLKLCYNINIYDKLLNDRLEVLK